MGKVAFGVAFVAVLLVCCVMGWALAKSTPEQDHARAMAEATRLAIENEKEQVELYVQQQAAGVHVRTLQGFYVVFFFAGTLFLCGLAVVIPLWLYNRASMAYPRGGLYPVIMRPGLRGVTIYDPNRLPGPDPTTTTQAQAVQVVAALAHGHTSAQDRAAVLETAGRVFQPQPRAEGLIDPPLRHCGLTLSHVERLLLEGGQDDDNNLD